MTFEREPGAGSADPATAQALQRLRQSREGLARWMEARAHSRAAASARGFQPRSATMRALMSAGRLRLPWIRWGLSLLVLLRSMRRR